MANSIGSCRVFAAGMLALALVAGSTQGQDIRSARGSPAAADQLAPAERAGIISSIITTWSSTAKQRGFDERWQLELRAALDTAAAGNLIAASEATDYEGVVAALSGSRGASGTNLLGSDASDLVYFPVTPCRIVDTRLAAAGPIVPGVPRSFVVNGSLTVQGGNAAGCGLPTDPAAVVITLTTARSAGSGRLTAYPYLGAVPTITTMRFFASEQVSNTTTLPICQICGSDFTVQAYLAQTDLAIDVVGYFWSPSRTPVNVTSTFVNQIIPTAMTFDFNAPACPAGYSATGGGWDQFGAFTGVFNRGSRPAGNAWNCRGYNNSGSDADIGCYAICTQTPGR